MLNKTFIQCLFGSPWPWTGAYLEHFARLGEFGWSMKVFTKNKLSAPANVEIIPMTVEEYDDLLLKHTGVKAGNYLKNGVPAKLISDHYCAWGQVFQDYLKGVNFWAITNWDMVYGRLDRALPDSELEKWEIWSDDPAGFNGIFTLMKNTEKVNNMFREVPNWEHYFTLHQPCAFDEILFTEVLKKASAEGRIAWGHPLHFPIHSYDRLAMHRPTPHLYFETDGTLIEWYEDPAVSPPSIRRHFGREIPLFHFNFGKRWPIGPRPA
jgi:hypothetical protein